MKKSYVIEDTKENTRLNFQNKIDVYDLDHELNFFHWNESDMILDAGCGNGNVIEKLIERGMQKIHGVDFSKERVDEANLRFKNIQGVEVFNSSLENTSLSHNSYDRIISRYVYEHLTNAEEVTAELIRLLKPGSPLYIIEFDDIFFDFYTKNEKLNKQLKDLKNKLPNDFGIAPKIPQMLKKNGMENIEWEAQTYFFKGERLNLEKENNRMRLEQGRKHLSQYFSNTDEYDQFSKDYLKEMDDDCNVMKTTKYLIKAFRPKINKLSII